MQLTPDLLQQVVALVGQQVEGEVRQQIVEEVAAHQVQGLKYTKLTDTCGR